jgi:hypothetical protein
MKKQNINNSFMKFFSLKSKIKNPYFNPMVNYDTDLPQCLFMRTDAELLHTIFIEK